MRRVAALTMIAVLLGLAVATERHLQSFQRVDPLEHKLLFVPSEEALRLLSCGNNGLMADILYVWAIQYYSVYSPDERYLYLETMLDLITDLDPRYYDAYAVGGLILGQASLLYPARRQALVQLYDKGIAAMPEDYILPELAAWDFYTLFNDVDTALRFAAVAAARPNAPNRILRVMGRWRDTNQRWTVDESIEYWQRAAAEAPNERERSYCVSHLIDVILGRDRQELNPILQTFAETHHRCPSSWSELVQRGVIASEPPDPEGKTYGINPTTCTIIDTRRIR